jgi:lipopolysaccharide biosynthesis glycosyltransferase
LIAGFAGPAFLRAADRGDPLHIVSAADDAYVAHFCAMLHSAWLFHPDARYYLLTPGMTDENMGLLADFVRQRNITLEIVEIDPE